MAESHSEENSLGSPLEHIKMCESDEHDEFPIDIMCEDCKKFICSECVKTDHNNHNWKTLTTAAFQRRRGLPTLLKKIKEEDLPGIEEKMEKMSTQMTENKELCDSEIKKLQKHVDEIMVKLIEIKKRHEKTLMDNLMKKNDHLNHVKSEIEKKKRGIVDTMKFMEENNSTMSNHRLIDNHIELTKMLSEFEVQMTNYEHSICSMRFIRGVIKDGLLESLVGKILDINDTNVNQLNLFQYGDKEITVLEAFNETQSYIKKYESKYIEEVNQQGTKTQQFSTFLNDICMAENSDGYFTNGINKIISCLSPSGSVSTVTSTDPLEPEGICQSVEGGLLVTLIDNVSDLYKLDSRSKRLVRHITVTGDIIHEYEYQEDGQTRLFTWPHRIAQNSNSDICVVNRTSDTTGELVIMFPSGSMKSFYRGQNLTKYFYPTDVVCDSLCNILVTDSRNNQIHLLSVYGEFLKFLLTEEVKHPLSLSQYKSILWVGYSEGIVKVFRYSV